MTNQKMTTQETRNIAHEVKQAIESILKDHNREYTKGVLDNIVWSAVHHIRSGTDEKKTPTKAD
jgi:hypothetical protein